MGRKRRLKGATTVTFHAEQDILDEFDEQADTIGVSRAKLLRMCMEDHVGRDFEDWPKRHRVLHDLERVWQANKNQRKRIEELEDKKRDLELRCHQWEEAYDNLKEAYVSLKQERGGR